MKDPLLEMADGLRINDKLARYLVIYDDTKESRKAIGIAYVERDQFIKQVFSVCVQNPAMNYVCEMVKEFLNQDLRILQKECCDFDPKQ